MEIVIRAACIFFFLWIVTKALGKRELAQMSAFELILLVVVGDLIQQGATQDDRSLGGAMLAVGTIALLIVVMSYFTYKSERVSNVLEGHPTVVVRDGRPVDSALRVERLRVKEVEQAARDQGIADLRDIRFGILEPEGQFSFILRDDIATRQQQVSREGPEVS